MSPTVETVIIGGGQAGLATSYHLAQRDRENVVLEQAAQPANVWRNNRWDSFALVTPNWSFRLPGAEYDGPAANGFMERDEIIARLEQYIEKYRLPVQYQTRVTAIEQRHAGRGYRVITDDTTLEAENVVIATGRFQRPRVPAGADGLSASLIRMASGQYRNPDSLPPGAVLVVGSAQSGCQIARDLYQAGRRVFLCVGSTGRAPRRYRGKDLFEWFDMMGFLERKVGELKSPQEKFAPNPQVSGARGGQSLNLHQFARDGVVLLGRLQGAQGTSIRLAPDLKENLAKADRMEGEFTKLIDQFIAKNALDVASEELPLLRDGFNVEVIDALDVRAAGISTVIWATGYEFDYSLVKLPVTDRDGFPITRRGVTEIPGLYFVGMPWLYTPSSGLFSGVGRDAAYIASHIAGETE